MNRKYMYGLRLVYNMIRMPIKRVVSFGKIKSSWMQLISPASKLVVENGRIRLSSRLVTEPNSLIHAVSGEISIKDAFINRNSMIVCMERVEIGSGVTIGPNVCIYDHDHAIENRAGGGTLLPLLKSKMECGLVLAALF